MKKITLALIAVLLFEVGAVKAQEQKLSVSEPISSGCLSRSSGEETPSSPIIKLTKEGSILSIDLFNYNSNCGTTGFEVDSRMSGGNDNSLCSVAISVTPIVPAEADCTCPFNISYTVRNLEKNNFYLTCWWYEGQVELTEGEPLVLEYKTEDVVIDSLKFRLLKVTHQAMLLYQNTWEKKSKILQIPSEVVHEGEKYTVTSINQSVFASNNTIKQIMIPKTIKNTGFGNAEGIAHNPFNGCLSLESIDVEEGNPVLSSVDGVLFNMDRTILMGYPVNSSRESYTVPDGVKTAADGAFYQSQNLKRIVMPNNMEVLGFNLFGNSRRLEEVILPSSIKELPAYLFKDCKKLKSFIIPKGVTSIGYSAFEGCKSMQSFDLPESINYIGGFAFRYLSNLKNVYCHASTVPGTDKNAFHDVDLSKVNLYVPAVAIADYEAASPWNQFGAVVPLETQNDYIPFVELGKTWHAVSSVSYNQQNYHFSTYWMNEEVERDGKTYIRLWESLDDLTEVTAIGLFREEGRRVYEYDEKKNKEVMLYDFSLKEGDTFTYEFNPGFPQKCKVMKQGYLYDGPQIVSSITRYSADSLDINYRNLRTWTIGIETEPDNYYEITTWIEGIGGLVNMFRPHKGGVVNSLAYIERNNYGGDVTNNYLPFDFYNMYGFVHGCDLPTGKTEYAGTGDKHQLTYEMIGNRILVSGRVLTQGGFNNYAYFIEEPTDDPLVRKLHFEIQEAKPLPLVDRMVLRDTYFYVSGFNSNMSYIVVDNQGEEHPVINRTPQNEYRPFVEEGKVWKVGYGSDNPVQRVEYYYFDGDTIIGGKVCKQMMCQRYVAPEHPDYEIIMRLPLLSYVGAWYEDDKKVYVYDTINNQFQLMYDFSAGAYDTLSINNQLYAIGPRQTGGLKGFKGVYRDVGNHMSWWKGTWLEGVGSIEGPILNVYYGKEYHGGAFLMSCTVGDEVIYLNDEYEDGATPAEARKSRFDFTHTTKPRPKAPKKSVAASEQEGEMQSLYGEYNDQQLDIYLAPLDEAYLVRITNESGKAIYEKIINAGSIVGLSIDISTYAKGRYTVTVENSRESFTGQFDVQTTGIAEVRNKRVEGCAGIYNLQGQRIATLQKGLNIVNGRKVLVSDKR